jgi:hypothetical protein
MRVEQRKLVEVVLDECDALAERERIGNPSEEDRFAAYYLRWEVPLWREGGEEGVVDDDG